MNQDSTDKILGYLDAVRAGSKPLRLGPTLLRGYACPERCGGCCPVFTLDYLPGDAMPDGVEEREVQGVTIYTDKQQGHKGKHCRRLDLATGRCTIHGRHPFSCDFELVRFNIFAERYVPNQVAVRLFGRGWNMLRVEHAPGGRGTGRAVRNQAALRGNHC